MTNFIKATAISLALITGVAIAPDAAEAQTTTLIVDVDQVNRDSTAGKSGAQQLETKFGGKLKDVQGRLQTAVSGWNQQVEAAKKIMKPDGSVPPANEASLGAAQKTLNESKAAFDEVRQEIQTTDQWVKYQILEKLIPVTETIRRDRKGGSVVPRNSVLAFDAVNDITAAALQQLNATLTTVSITPPQQQQQAAGGTTPAAPTTPAKSQPQTR